MASGMALWRHMALRSVLHPNGFLTRVSTYTACMLIVMISYKHGDSELGQSWAPRVVHALAGGDSFMQAMEE